MMTLPIQPKRLFGLLRGGVALGVICILLGLAPFAVAQDVQHSDKDLCQWVQHHTAGSLDLDAPRLAVCELIRHQELPSESILLSIDLSFVGPSRAPPRS